MGMGRYRCRPAAPILIFALGLGLGVVARLLDIYTQTLGNVFSQFAIWILLGTVIAIYSRTPGIAMLSVPLFCVGMLITYYYTAYATDGVYSKVYIIGWTGFALCSPIMAFVAWHAKGQGLLAKVISIGIVAVSFASSILVFDRLRVYDYIINAALIYFLFFKRIPRNSGKE